MNIYIIKYIVLIRIIKFIIKYNSYNNNLNELKHILITIYLFKL